MSQGAFRPSMTKLNQVTPREAFEMMKRGDAVQIIDVRQPAEYRDGHVEPSRLVPLGELAARTGELDRTRTLLTLCRSGSRSTLAAQQLSSAGFDVRNIEGGILRWIAEKLPIVKGA